VIREPLPVKNELRAALPRGARRRLLPHPESVSLPPGTNRFNPCESIEHIYFPEDALVYFL